MLRTQYLVFTLILLFPLHPITGQAPEAVTRSGPVMGTATQDGHINIFRGIPFAAPPVDSLRWRAPQPPAPWTEPKVCTTFAASPVQRDPEPFSMWSAEFLIPKEPIDEDCLYLNVWAGAQAKQQPVLVWIYGGGFNSGGGSVPIYDGEALAGQGVVVVTVNYRVGPFGFFAHPELSAEAPYGTSGNYGLLDQIAALRWVRDNITAFGGDPDRVTIAGQSAGAASVHALVASPLAAGLFQRAIAESGAMMTRGGPPLAEAEAAGERFAAGLGASNLEALRGLSAAEILAAADGSARPIQDGYVLPASPTELTTRPHAGAVDLLTGWNEDEGLLFGPILDLAAYRQQIRERYGEDAADYLAQYPATDDATAKRAQLDASRDQIFGIQNYAWANVHADYSERPVYVYRFTRKVPGEGQYADYGAFHTAEVPYAFGNLHRVDRPFTAIDHRLSAAMQQYWVNFVKHGNPNAPGLPLWPVYTAATQDILLLGDTVEAAALPDGERLDFMYYLQTVGE